MPLGKVWLDEVLSVEMGEHVFPGLGHERSCPGELGGEHGAHLLPLLQYSFLALLCENGAHASSHHLLVGIGHPLEKVSGEMNSAALPAVALQH